MESDECDLKSTNGLSTKDASVTVINVHDTNDDENDKKTERGKLNQAAFR